MTKLYKGIVNHPKSIIALFLAAFVVCLLCWQMVAVNYAMNDYLPPDSASTLALEWMEQEYDGGIPNARVMVQNVSLAEALAYKEKLLAVDGVSDVTWLDDAANITVPLETLDPDTVESYYKDGNALFSVTIDLFDARSAFPARHVPRERHALLSRHCSVRSAGNAVPV